MAIQFIPGQVATGDPYPNAPTALSGPVKDLQTRVVKLSSANFTTTGTNTLVAVLPADATIISFRTWVKTALAGNSVASPTVTLGSTSAGTDYASTVALTNTTGTYAFVTPVTGIIQAYNPPYSADLNIWFKGGCSTGNPTSGEVYLIIEYVR